MNARHLLFTTDRFNLSVTKGHFINPSCFGEDLGTWLQGKLTERGIGAGRPGQEDWGWFIRVRSADRAYFLAMNGCRGEDKSSRNRGEWRIIVVKRRSIWERVTGAGKITDDDGVLRVIREILQTEPDFCNVRVETV
jgi:hypothetical protein